jgi:hypothetical protein
LQVPSCPDRATTVQTIAPRWSAGYCWFTFTVRGPIPEQPLPAAATAAAMWPQAPILCFTRIGEDAAATCSTHRAPL